MNKRYSSVEDLIRGENLGLSVEAAFFALQVSNPFEYERASSFLCSVVDGLQQRVRYSAIFWYMKHAPHIVTPLSSEALEAMDAMNSASLTET